MDLLPNLCLLCCFCCDRKSRDEEKYDRDERLDLAVKRNLEAEPATTPTSEDSLRVAQPKGTRQATQTKLPSQLLQARQVGAGMEYRRSHDGTAIQEGGKTSDGGMRSNRESMS
jgi:hypothetical protein